MKLIFEKKLDLKKEFKKRVYSDYEKKALLSYLKKDTHNIGVVCGTFIDFVTGEYKFGETLERYDGVFIWHDDDAYHIEKYNAAVTDEFLQYVLDKTSK